MSTPVISARLSVPQLGKKKEKGEKIVVLTAYTVPVATAADAHADILLVGDSLGMVLYGLPSTLQVSLADMIRHGAAVVRASARAMVAVDLPFGSYQASPQQAFKSASRVLRQSGCAAVKLEGGAEMADTVRFLTQRAIPVIGHIGLKPQYIHTLGGYRYQGRTQEETDALIADARALEEAGAFAIVLECVETSAAAQITQAIGIPTIGIGAGSACDGQVLVSEDLLGMTASAPRFVKRYAALAGTLESAFGAYANEVRQGGFPSPEHGFTVSP